MIRLLFLTFILCGNVQAQPIACKEDAHCNSGYFCESNTHACHKCLNCSDLGREASQSIELTDCIKAAVECGPCFEGLVKDYIGDVKACVRPELEILKYFTDPLFFSCMAALIGFILIVMYMIHVYRTTTIIKVVAYSILTPFPQPKKIFNGKQLLGTYAF